MELPLPQEYYTYDDYLTWPDDVRYELIDGVPYLMSPAPTSIHQGLVGDFFGAIHSFLQGKSCKVFTAPFDVRLPKQKKSGKPIDTVVQPDISVICKPEKIARRGCLGAPDWIIEVVSPSTASQDYVRKLNLYELHGVREYWIVHPIDQIVAMFRLEADGLYGRPTFLVKEDQAVPVIFDGELSIDLGAIFVAWPPDPEDLI